MRFSPRITYHRQRQYSQKLQVRIKVPPFFFKSDLCAIECVPFLNFNKDQCFIQIVAIYKEKKNFFVLQFPILFVLQFPILTESLISTADYFTAQIYAHLSEKKTYDIDD